MALRTWLITGVSSGFGRELTQQLLGRGDRVVGTVRHTSKVTDVSRPRPGDVPRRGARRPDTRALRDVVDRSFPQLGRIDVVVSDAGERLLGAAEELSDEQVDPIVATNLTGSIQLIRSALPHLRVPAGVGSSRSPVRRAGRLPRQLHLPRHTVEDRGVLRVGGPGGRALRDRHDDRRAGGARTEFRYGSAQVTKLMPVYDDTPAHSFLAMLDPTNGLAPGDPARMAARMIESGERHRRRLQLPGNRRGR